MDQYNRPDLNRNQPNFQVHIHHSHCNCPGCIYATYYPFATIGFTAPLPPLVLYRTPSVTRHYLQLYTQFNMGSPYPFPIGPVTGSGTSVQYGPSNLSSPNLVNEGNTIRENRECSGNAHRRRNNEPDPLPPEGYTMGQITPPDNGVSVNELSTEDFVKFLDRRCIIAQQIAYRNRNRWGFRNVQHLCVRTRLDIARPCNSISNIQAQGIPFATKDFIYAFLRLIDCWHIVRNYWDNREGFGLEAIEKELSSEFGSCFLKWEKLTKEMTNHMSNTFYNLETNFNASSSDANLDNIPSQVELDESSSEATSTTGGINFFDTAEDWLTQAADQAKRIVSGFEAEENCNGSNFSGKNYFTEGWATFNPNQKASGATSTTGGINFFDTAHNVQAQEDCAKSRLPLAKIEEVVNSDKDWLREAAEPENLIVSEFEAEENCNGSNFSGKNYFTEGWAMFNPNQKASEATSITGGNNSFDTAQEDWGTGIWSNPRGLFEVKKTEVGKADMELNFSSSTQTNVDQWPINQNFTEDGEANSPTAHQQELIAYTMNSLSDSLSSMDLHGKQCHQVEKFNPYELQGGGITAKGQYILDCLIDRLKEHILGTQEEADIDRIIRKIRDKGYLHINEVVSDLKYSTKKWDELYLHNNGLFTKKLNSFLTEQFKGFNFDHIKGDPKEKVGPLTEAIFCCDCNQFI